MISAEIETTLGKSVGKDLRQVMPQIAELAAKSIRMNFLMGGRPNAWPPLRGGGETPLVASGRLYRSIHTDSGEDWAEVIAGPHPAARVHQYGATFWRSSTRTAQFFWHMFHDTGNVKWKFLALWAMKNNIGVPLSTRYVIPARPYMVLQDTDIAAMTKLLGEFATELI